MLTALLNDGFVRAAIAVWLFILALYFLPIVPAGYAVAYGDRYLEAPWVLLAVLSAWVGLGRLHDRAERRFWLLVGVAFLFWLLVLIPYVTIPTAEWTQQWDLTADILYLLFYIFLVVAIELRPHEQHTGSVGERERQLRTVGLTVFGFFVLTYFVFIPATYSVDDDPAGAASYYMYLLLDLIVVLRLLWMRRETWSVRWSAIYAWLATAATLILVGDAVETSYVLDHQELPSGVWIDHLWMVPVLLFVIGIRARHAPFPAEQRVLNEIATPRRVLRAGHVLLVCAMVLPFAHYALYAADVFSSQTLRALREVISVASMVVLGSLALVAYRVLEGEREQMEEKELRLLNELGVARKMDAVARLAGSVAHDFNNLVQVVRGRAEIIGQQIGRDNPMHEDIREIRAAAARAADLASQLMTFGRKQPSSLTAVSLHEVLMRAEKLLKPLIDERTRLVLRLRAATDVVRIDPLQFERIILNLATNARDAMPDGGTLTIETANPDSSATIGAYADRARILLRVHDTGVGMDAETINHIFEPFFTTKEQRGAGLGLAIVHGLIQQFGGTISVDSTPGAGTTFTMTLPVVSDVPAALMARRVAADKDEAPNAVLIVEGDTTNRQLLRRLLSDLERPVLATATAAEALLISGRYSGPVDLAVIDVTIENGRTLGRRLREGRPKMRVLLLAQDQPVDLADGDELLREPFELADVLRTAKRLMVNKPQGS